MQRRTQFGIIDIPKKIKKYNRYYAYFNTYHNQQAAKEKAEKIRDSGVVKGAVVEKAIVTQGPRKGKEVGVVYIR